MSKEIPILFSNKEFPVTHKELVNIAYRWLLKNSGMTVAFKELYSIASEIPDVIGFNSWESAIIECKASRADFLSDKKKKHRSKGMGNWRFYCCPKGMIKKEELPPKWGLIYVEKGVAKVEYNCQKKRVKDKYVGYAIVRSDENLFDADQKAERNIMFTVIRRLFIRGYIKHIYNDKHKKFYNTNTLIELNDNGKTDTTV